MTFSLPSRWKWLIARGIRCVIVLYGTAAAVMVLVSSFLFVPAEDAVILWIYSTNLARNGVISYLAHGPRAEGATDFAWMVLVAGAVRCHLNPLMFTGIVNLVALIALTYVLTRCAGVTLRIDRVALVAGVAACLPQAFAVIAGFATLEDGFLLVCTGYFIVRRNASGASVCALVFCLFRPDAIVFVLPLLLALLYGNRTFQSVRAVVLGFVIPGMAYEIWRIRYFHEPFPLPFLVKSDAHRIAGFLVATSLKSSLVYVCFAGIVIGSVWACTRREFRGADLLPGLVVVPTCFYWCMRLDQNVGFRFFYYLPVSAALVLALNWQTLGGRRVTVILCTAGAWLVLVLPPLRREFRTFRDLQSPELVSVASDLKSVPHTGPLLTSEAGILPFYSHWDAVDPWGLNTPEFAHRFFQPGDVASLRPSLVHIHPDVGEGCSLRPDWSPPYAMRSWPALTRNMIAGIDRAQYDLVQTSYGSEAYRRRKGWGYGEGDVACWYIRRGTAEHDAVQRILLNHHGRMIANPLPQ